VATATGDAGNIGGYFLTGGNSGIAVYGQAMATGSVINYGGQFQTAGNAGTGVYGLAYATGQANNYGGQFEARGDSGSAVYGLASATGNVGNYGGQFLAEGNYGAGVYGVAFATGATRNWGGNFAAAGDSGIGVYGLGGAVGNVTNYGGVFEADGNYGVGVHGIAAGPGGTGVRGDGGYNGVYGESEVLNGNGIEGIANNGASAYGVWGQSSSGYAGQFTGNVGVSGNLYVTGTKAFKIDHPLDPANKYLIHYAIESPTVQNLYNGTILLDAYGEAVVQLPDYFEALNAEEFTYTLTPIGASMPNLHVAEKVQNNQFKISGGVGGKEVSWVLIGQRNDPWVKQNPAKDVMGKPKEEVGTYLHPKGHGQPETLSLEYVLKRQKKP